MAKALLLARKWQNKADNFQDIRKRALDLVPELGLSFEEVKEESVPENVEIKKETKDKGKQQVILETTKEPRTWLEGESRILVKACWALCFLLIEDA